MLTSWPSPVSLSREEIHRPSLGVHFPRLSVNNPLLRLKRRAGIPFVVDTDDTVAKFKSSPRTTGRKSFENGQLSLSVHGVAEVKIRSAWDGVCSIAAIESDNFLVGELEC